MRGQPGSTKPSCLSWTGPSRASEALPEGPSAEGSALQLPEEGSGLLLSAPQGSQESQSPFADSGQQAAPFGSSAPSHQVQTNAPRATPDGSACPILLVQQAAADRGRASSRVASHAAQSQPVSWPRCKVWPAQACCEPGYPQPGAAGCGAEPLRAAAVPHRPLGAARAHGPAQPGPGVTRCAHSPVSSSWTGVCPALTCAASAGRHGCRPQYVQPHAAMLSCSPVAGCVAILGGCLQAAALQAASTRRRTWMPPLLSVMSPAAMSTWQQPPQQPRPRQGQWQDHRARPGRSRSPARPLTAPGWQLSRTSSGRPSWMQGCSSSRRSRRGSRRRLSRSRLQMPATSRWQARRPRRRSSARCSWPEAAASAGQRLWQLTVLLVRLPACLAASCPLHGAPPRGQRGCLPCGVASVGRAAWGHAALQGVLWAAKPCTATVRMRRPSPGPSAPHIHGQASWDSCHPAGGLHATASHWRRPGLQRWQHCEVGPPCRRLPAGRRV